MKYTIRDIRKAKGITASELAEKSGVTRATIWKLETGENPIANTNTLGKLATALGVPINDLFIPESLAD